MSREYGSELPPLGKRGEGWVATQLVLGGIAVLLGIVGPDWPPSVATPLTAVGALAATIGVLFLLAGIVTLGSSLTPFPKPKAEAPLREGGVFGLVRHPLYGGAMLIFAGWSMASSPLALFPTASLVVLLELKSRREEAWLVEQYDGYEAYRARVRWKFVPGIR
jgi:protein-S-isoprenylcysteine O-methyltransferase Ste14